MFNELPKRNQSHELNGDQIGGLEVEALLNDFVNLIVQAGNGVIFTSSKTLQVVLELEWRRMKKSEVVDDVDGDVKVRVVVGFDVEAIRIL